jgi:hypothetical protein
MLIFEFCYSLARQSLKGRELLVELWIGAVAERGVTTQVIPQMKMRDVFDLFS